MSFWKTTNLDLILKQNDINFDDISFKFFQKNMQVNEKHFYLCYELEKKNLFFHGVLKKYYKLNLLDSTYSGYIISDKLNSTFIKQKKEINEKLIKFLKKFNVDILLIHPNPLSIYKKEKTLPHQLYFNGYNEINGFLYIEKNSLDLLSYNMKREIKIGLKNINKYSLITESHPECFIILKNILKYELKQKIDMSYLENIYENAKKGLYKINMIIDGTRILCLLIVSIRPGMASQTYNYSAKDYKKEFINKALHYKIIKELFDKNLIEIFVFGDSIDDSNGMKSVTSFKQSFCKNSLISIKIKKPISNLGRIILFLQFLKKRINA